MDIKEPDEKSIMTYVAQFLQYARELPVTDGKLMVSLPPGGWCSFQSYLYGASVRRCTVVCLLFLLPPGG